MTKNYLLNEINSSNKSFILYKSKKGFDLFSDFSKKIILNNKNINKFLKKKLKTRKKLKNTDLFIGFFGYEILNNLIGVKLPKQKSINFPKGIFYKPETKVSLKDNLFYKSNSDKKVDKNFKININQNTYTKIFNRFKKKIRSDKCHQILFFS